MTRKNKVTNITDKVVQERMALLEADPEYVDLGYLLPKVLMGKESGKDFHGVTSDREIFENNKGVGVILLSRRDMEKWGKFGQLCDKLAHKYGLGQATVEDLAMGVKKPIVSPRLSRTMTARLDPFVIMPRKFDRAKHCIADYNVIPPLAVMEIMRRVQQLDQKTKDEINAYLFSIYSDLGGCRTVELREGARDEKLNKIEFDICLKIPSGYTAREVGELYHRVDMKRRDILTVLGMSVTKRRRQSKVLMEAERLELLLPKKDVTILGITDEESSGRINGEARLRKSIVNRRYKGKKLIQKHLQG